jgi:ketosteroid isomerase-like protein
MSTVDFVAAVEQTHRALLEFVKGNPVPLQERYSHQDDVTLANPFGPVVRGWEQGAATMERAAAYYRDGEGVGFEGIAQCVTPDLAYTVEMERYKAKIGGREDIAPFELRVTTIFRPEDGTWKIVHRHADPITTVQGPESLLKR